MNLATAVLTATLALQSGPSVAPGESQPPADVPPEQLEGVGIDEKLGTELPTDTELTTHDGREVTLGDVIPDDKPTILTFNYSDCPMLCSVQLNGLTESLRGMDWTLGEQYQVVTVSIDPTETPERAAETRERYLSQYERDAAEGAWPFLVADDEETIQTLTDSVGFGHQLNEENGQWLHVAALVLLTPAGADPPTVSRYLYGVRHSPRTVQLSLAEASEGKQVSTLDAAILYCFSYDPDSGTYTPVVFNIMRLGGAVTAVAVFAFVLTTVLRSRRRKRSESQADGAPIVGSEPDRSPST